MDKDPRSIISLATAVDMWSTSFSLSFWTAIGSFNTWVSGAGPHCGNGEHAMAGLLHGAVHTQVDWLDFAPGMLLGLFLVAVIKGGAHVAYLGRPERFWRAFARPRTSWISRGLIGVAVFIAVGGAYLLFRVAALGWIAMAAAIFVMLYTGYLMAFSPSIPFWNSALLPVLFLVYSAESGTALSIPLYATATGGDVRALESVAIVLLLLVAILIYSYLYGAYHSSLSARESVRLLFRGRLLFVFTLAVVLLGLVIPFALAVFTYVTAGANHAAMWLAAILGMQGALLCRWLILRAGVYAPPRY